MLLVWAWTEWVCIVAGKCLVDPPPLPARRSWGKVLLCHKGLGGVFCVSGPDVCQPKGLVYQLENLWVQLASQSFLVGPPVVLLSTLQPSFLVFSSPSFPRVGPSLCPVSPTHSPSSLLLPSLLPFSFFVPRTTSDFPFAPFRLSS